MKIETFTWIWKQIQETIDEIKKRFDSCDLADSFHFRLIHGEETENVIKNRYIEIRDELKRMCYPETEFDEALLDQHKLAACFCKAIIDKKVFVFDINDQTPPDMIRSNYELAYVAGLRIVQIYMMDYYCENYGEDSEYVKWLKRERGLYGPHTTHDSYHLGRIKTLALNDYYGIEFDVLTYADMMFWIEYYNRQKIENKIEIEYKRKIKEIPIGNEERMSQ